MRKSKSAFLALVSFLFLGSVLPVAALGEDWPTWRFDAARSASSSENLPAELHLQWIREYPALEPAWEDPVNQDRMPFDRVYEPVVMASTLLFGSNLSDKVTALDTRTGREKWRFYADGPVRLPPAAWKGRVYFVSDDGYLYCLDAETGSLVWKFRGGPRDRRILGNGRMISTWPARGGVVIQDGEVYFAAGIWPFMGTFIHAVDAETGRAIWTNDGLSSAYINQPHRAPSFAGIAPQGSLAVAGEKLLIPGGRSVPGCFDRKTGKLLYFHLAGSPLRGGGPRWKHSKLEGSSHVSATGKFFLSHRGLNTCLYDLETGELCLIWKYTTYPVLDGDTCYLSGNPVTACDLKDIRKVTFYEDVKDRKTKKIKKVQRHRWEIDKLWQLAADGSGAMIKAGDRLYAGGENTISAIDISKKSKPRIAWTKQLEGTVGRIIAADGRLFVVTLQGRIYAFGAEEIEPRIHSAAAPEAPPADEISKHAKEILKATDIREGYCLAFGLGTGRLVEELVRNSDLHVVAVDPDREKVEALRRRFDAAGLYGKRISVHVGRPSTFEAPPYVASLTIFEDLQAAGFDEGEAFVKHVFRSMRPYGGAACLPIGEENQRNAFNELVSKAQLAGAKVVRSGRYVLLVREGPLPGAAYWTHQYGDIANTAKSDDKLVKAPLGLLWFGGNTHQDVLPRHAHGPPEQVVGGRLFIQGINMLSARDVYTGRVLWKRTFPDLGTFDVYYDESYRDDPLDTTYNQKHIPGANVRGTNYVVTPDKIYLAIGGDCLVLDPATGQTITKFSLPTETGATEAPSWGYIGVYKDLLIAGSEFIRFSKKHGMKKNPRHNIDFASSEKLIVMDRHTGQVLWAREADCAFWHNAIAAGAGKLFCIDLLPKAVVKMFERRGQKIDFKPVLLALDVRTGKEIWRKTENVFGTWLGYSRQHDILLQSGRSSRDMVSPEPIRRMITHRGTDGAIIWDKPIKHSGPCMIHGRTIYLNAHNDEAGAVDLLTGETKMQRHPLTARTIPWLYQRAYGCNSSVASEYLLTFRSGAAGYYDLTRESGTGNLGGFKSGCTSNLIAADGVLNAPDYTRTCTCTYQNQTSLALIHDPDVEIWTFSKMQRSGGPLRRVGINFGAPGDRRADNGTLWLDYPSVGGPSPDIPVRIEADSPRWFRHHSSRINAGPLKWVAASGAEGLISATITLTEEASEEMPFDSCTVRLWFSEPDDLGPAERVFDVTIQGQKVLEDFDIVKAAGGPNRAVVKEFKGIQAKKDLTLTFAAKAHLPLLCGVEIVAEQR